MVEIPPIYVNVGDGLLLVYHMIIWYVYIYMYMYKYIYTVQSSSFEPLKQIP